MKKWITLAFIAFTLVAAAQNAQYNTWTSNTYKFADESPGIKTIKTDKPIVSFNEGAVAFYCKKTGLILFNYVDVPHNDTTSDIYWEGYSLPSPSPYTEYGTYVIKFRYGKRIEIQKTTGHFWYVLMEPIQQIPISYTDIRNRK